jgi:L-cystine transport system substrate-binding protein
MIMKKINVLRRALSCVLAVLLSSSLAACGNTESDSGSDVKKIPVGVVNTAKPDAYIDDSGKLTGYDVEVLRAIDELLPQYELDLQTMEFTEILNGLTTGRILAGSQEFEWNADREANYLFGTVPLIGYNTYILTLDKPEYENVKGLEDFAGKSTFSFGGSGSWDNIISKFNEEHPDKEIKQPITYTAREDFITAITNGTIDFSSNNEQGFALLTQQYDTSKLKLHLDAKIYDSNSFILFGKTQTQLQKDFDGALQQLTDSGKLAELSIQFYGKDYTVKK